MDTAGDGFFATFDGPARAIRCAESIVQTVRDLGIEVRPASIPARCRRSMARPAVSRSASETGRRARSAFEILVSQTVKDLTPIRCRFR